MRYENVGDDGDDGVQIAIGGASGADVSYTSTDDVIRITPGIGVFIFDNAK